MYLSNMFFNINGRTSLFYAICWGIISIFLINFINPNIDKSIFKSLDNVNMNCILTYTKDGKRHSFLEEYDKQ